MTDDLIEHLRTLGLRARAYRARNVRSVGHRVAAVMPDLPDLALLGPDLHEGLKVDCLALEFIAYWPDVRIPPAHELLDEVSHD